MPLCCGARVSCSPHRPCLVPFLAPSQYGKTAFHYAVENGHVAAMELLLAQGADPKAKDEVSAPLGSLMAAIIEVRAAGGAKVDAERSSDGLSMSMFFKPCPERAMLLIAPSISTWRRPPKTRGKKERIRRTRRRKFF